MSALEASVPGILQGLTEFLSISYGSPAHRPCPVRLEGSRRRARVPWSSSAQGPAD